MLVFISDLHITDKTTGVQYLAVDAFEEAMHNIARQAQNAKAQEIIIVFLGDIFDLVRTTFWLEKPLKERPWGILEDATEEEVARLRTHATDLLNRIININRELFDLWSQPVAERFNLPVEPRRVYIPGNHDRICNQFPELRQIIIETLGLNINQDQPLDPALPFPYYYHHPLYRVFARHGQEWDQYNFEHTADWSQPDYIIPPARDYLEIPIGELIAAEVASRLPTAVCSYLQGKIDDEDLQLIARHMQTVDDVRPFGAILPWLIDSVRTQLAMQRHSSVVLQAFTRAAHSVAGDFDKLPFTKAWMKKHDGFAPFDYVDRLQLAILALKNLKVSQLDRILQMADSRPTHALEAILRLVPCLDKSLTHDNYATAALEDMRRISRNPAFVKTLYILYGHTHRADQVPLDTPSDSACQVYLNTGTWRPLYRQTISQTGFMRWKNLTFTIFYNSEADPENVKSGDDPVFETWTGSLLDPL